MTSPVYPSIPVLSLVAVGLLTSLSPAHAGDPALERAHLVAAVRQLDMLDRLAEHAASASPSEHSRSRYHFDYARLREDLERVRAGIHDYLTPQRAQPRDPEDLAGNYVAERPEPEDAP
ncbi:raqprd family integrative conjugative element protein [Pseudomonas sp. PIC25]|uniref:integrative conjugative element protein, RAQPRD family n=1 Tax=Pseudomonas sp. PIC25 TaxID=1958773 RepID=UPI000BAB7E3F|nr:RAQPRD family integrative conjugative element protein [Pseudomonas sp. PIC25]PAU51968.1 raqprd family integrative conjugative element protein [Pseudomonas sp. PIC25]